MKRKKPFGIGKENEGSGALAVYRLACIYSLLDKEISDYLRPFELTPARFNALMIIKHKGKNKGLSQIEVGRLLIVTASNMTRLLDKLVKYGLVELSGQKGDRRVNLVKITKKGSDSLDKIWPGYNKKVTELTSRLNKEDLKQVSGLLLKWFKELEKV